MVYANTSMPLKIVASIANPTPEVVSKTYCLDENYNVTFTDLRKTLRELGHIDGSTKLDKDFSIKFYFIYNTFLMVIDLLCLRLKTDG